MASRFTVEIKPFNHLLPPPPPTTENRVTCHWELFSGKGVLNSYSHHPFLNGMNSLARTTSRAERNMKPGIAENVVAAHSSIFMTFILIHSAEEFNLTDFSRCTDEIWLALVSRAVRVCGRMFWTIMVDFDTPCFLGHLCKTSCTLIIAAGVKTYKQDGSSSCLVDRR